MTPAATRIVDAAFRLFEEHGYDATSVDQIAEQAGVSRSTFFRHYGSKESVIFPDHDALLGAVEERLGASTERSAIAAVSDAVRLVLFHYVAEGERARQRYRLTSTVVALRERELVSGARYQRLFRRYISDWGDKTEASETRAELMAAAVVAAHNRVLRRWLRGECSEPQVEIDEALATVHDYFAVSGEPRAVVVVRTDADLAAVASYLKQL
ncbi:MAG TPA: helix-turn-helix domain-containing protein [Nocardioides sp.]|nr:helix-turn-helix domain-containing protein [Nocardioides sp.]